MAEKSLVLAKSSIAYLKDQGVNINDVVVKDDIPKEYRDPKKVDKSFRLLNKDGKTVNAFVMIEKSAGSKPAGNAGVDVAAIREHLNGLGYVTKAKQDATIKAITGVTASNLTAELAAKIEAEAVKAE